jgi:hypothetical protein
LRQIIPLSLLHCYLQRYFNIKICFNGLCWLFGLSNSRYKHEARKNLYFAKHRDLTLNISWNYYLYLYSLIIKHICVLILQRFRFFIKFLELISLIGLSYSSNNVTIFMTICVEVRIFLSILFVTRNAT